MTDLPEGTTAATSAANASADLRERAEARLQGMAVPGDNAAPPMTDAVRQLHELQVHQIELELQNDELRKARDVAEEAAARYAVLYDFSPVGYVTLNRAGAITRANLAAGQLLGTERARLAGKRLGAWLAGASAPAFNAFLQQSFEGADPPGCEWELNVKGHIVALQVDASVSNDAQVCRLVMVDISARKQAEQATLQANQELAQANQELAQANQELAQANVELARSNADLEQFAYAASHDLIEPLRSVTSSVQLLQKRYAGHLDARANTFIAHAVSGAARMQALITDLLTFARINGDAQQPGPVSMEAALTDACANLATAIAAAGAHLTHDPLPQVRAKSSQMTQLLQNLLANAIKFRGDKPAVVHVGARQKGDEWILSVADQGIGIEPKYFNRIFQLFKRLHTREEYAGTGIGLSLCKKIVERQGGRIWVESEVGQGATFYFTLPV
jgi:chemotaxis family two-component system sensor kinase Cph1